MKNSKIVHFPMFAVCEKDAKVLPGDLLLDIFEFLTGLELCQVSPNIDEHTNTISMYPCISTCLDAAKDYLATIIYIYISGLCSFSAMGPIHRSCPSGSHR